MADSNDDQLHEQQPQQLAERAADNFSAAAASASATAASTHPLQDINLDAVDHAAGPQAPQLQLHQQLPQPQSQPQQRKKNWVKFEDDVDDVEAAGENRNSNNNNNNFIAAAAAIDGEANTTRATRPLTAAENVTTTTTTAPVTAANRLSLPPPTKKQQTTTPSVNVNATARPRTPLERDQEPSYAAAAAAATAAPVQRSSISSTSMPDVAPAVLNTESTHVNLNASGRAQPQPNHHQHHYHQQYQQQKQQQQQQQQQLQQQQQQQKQQQQQSHQYPQQHQKSKMTNVVGTTTAGNSTSITNQNHQQQPPPTHQHHSNNGTSSVAAHKLTNVTIPVDTVAPPMRTIELSTGRIREGFANGDVIVTLLPANTKWPWITPAIFRPELVPEELMAQGLTLTVEEYVGAMETLVNDYRFTLYNICYKRILVCWILLAFTVLLTLLFSGLQGVALFSLGVGWLFLNAAAIFVCMWVKLRLSRGLEKCLARVNRQLIKHKILLILDDRGRMSCHKVNLCFLYFDATQCIGYLNEFLEHTEQNGGEAIKVGWERKLDIDLNDIVIQGSNPVRLSRKQERGMQLFLRYGSRWGMEALRGLVDVTPLEPGRHCGQFQCPCQYIKDHLQCKPRGYPCSCIAYASDPQLQNHL